MKADVSVLGHFGEGVNLLNGQTIKTKIITEELQRQVGMDQILKFDTHGGWKTLLKAPLQVFSALKNSKNILIFPAHNGLRVYAPLLSVQRKLFRDRKLHYVVIGGWLPEFLQNRPILSKVIKRFDHVYVETSTMKKALDSQGFTNITIMPNCKNLRILSQSELVYATGEPYKLCTFSRVMKEKGIEDAVQAVRAVNERYGRIMYTLDIYGQVDSAQTEWFEDLKAAFPEYIRYGGIVPFDQSVEVLKDYFALLFPTRFYTEGIPGTLIDAYAAGIPVISAKWESFIDIVDENDTGVGYDFADVEALINVLFTAAENPSVFNNMKIACLEKAKRDTPEKVIGILKLRDQSVL